MVIYVDELLVLNGLSTWLLLLCVRGFLQLKPTRKRLLLGSVVGALSSLWLLLPAMPKGLELFYQILSAALIGAAAFSGLGKRAFWRGTACLLLCSFLFAGVMVFIAQSFTGRDILLRGGVYYMPFSMGELILLCAGCYALLTVLDAVKGRRLPGEELCRVMVFGAHKSAAVIARVDTGCRLFDPLSGVPVMVCEKKAVTAALPDGFEKRAERHVTFAALSGPGQLPAFAPRKVVVKRGRQVWQVDDCLVAVCEKELGEGEFRALLGPSFLTGAQVRRAG